MNKSSQTSNKTAKASGKINRLVSLLPEIYQPIYKHPKLSQNVSRGCEDRLSHLVAVHNALREKLNRPVRVLDLGCAQGFFSLNLAAIGARVHGIDSLDKNIAVCQTLADESAGIQAIFETGRVEEIVATLLPDQFDLVLGLSVFHHLIHEQRLDFVYQLLDKLSQVIPAGIFEVALKNEPLYWGPSQPEDPAQVLQDYAFVHELAEHQTHLSEVKRPLYFASNRFWYLNSQIGYFKHVQSESHQYSHGTHQGTRRYYFGEGRIVKIFRMNVTELQLPNLQEYQNEVNFLSDQPVGFSAPNLILHGKNKKELWLVRDQLEGRLLVDYFETATLYDHEKVIGDILQQLVILERAGLYHNDVRCWNVLLSIEKRASLIDYGSISSERKDCVWPHDLLMAFIIFIREVVGHKAARPLPIRQPWLDIGVLPAIYRNAFLQLFATPKNQWSFSYLQQCIAQADTPQSLDPVNLADGFFALLSTMESASSIYEAKAQQATELTAQGEAEIQRVQQVLVERDQELRVQIAQGEVKAQQATERATQAEATSQQATELTAQGEAEIQRVQQVLVARDQELRVQIAQGEAEIQRLTGALTAVYHSRSWRITSPFRLIGTFVRWFVRGSVAWLTFAPMSRPRRVVSRIKDVTKSWTHRILAIGLQGIRSVPPLKKVLSSVARRYPSFGTPFLALAAAHPRPFVRTLRTARRKPVVIQLHHPIPLSTQRSLTAIPAKTKRVLYYYVDHTIDCPVNTGMQRVARSLARGLIDAGEDVVFVRWSPESIALVKINSDDVKHLCEWQGPSMSPKMTAVYPAPDSPDEPIDQHDCCDGSWLVVPEVTHINFHGYAPTLDVLMAAKEAKLKTAFIFYDAIQLRRDEFATMAPLHAEYMQQLLLADLVVPISRWSARDLVSFFVHHEKSELTAIPVIEPLLLPGETLLTDSNKAFNKLNSEIPQSKTINWTNYVDDFLAQLNSFGSSLGTVYYCVHATCNTPFNSGIQRVNRALAHALMQAGAILIPIKWDINLKTFIGVTQADLEFLSIWNGPSVDQWHCEFDVEQISPYDWLLSTEVLLDPDDLDSITLERWAKARGLRTAWVFYDAIPWKLRDIFPVSFTKVHTLYMRGLETATLIFPISKYSANELIRVTDVEGIRMPDCFDRVIATPLPGEFLGTNRVYQISKHSLEIVRILCVCTVETRKNHLGLLRAFEEAQHKTNIKLELWLVGRAAPEPELIAKVKQHVDSNQAIYWEQEADDSRLHELYEYCDFTVYPSVEEGFGLPILESLWNARPCICHNSGAMAEVAMGGGCLMVDAVDVDALALGIIKLATDKVLLMQLAGEAVIRPFKKWTEYAEEIILSLIEERKVPHLKTSIKPDGKNQFYKSMVNLEERPLLSICITTYNRAEWLALSLKNLARLMPGPIPGVEIVVCDNTSTDHTPDIVKPYEARPDFRYYRNPSNVGMLGNLRVTAHHARGQYIWILGDDDLVAPGAIEKVLATIYQNPDAALLYLNYAYTHEEDAKRITDLDRFFAHATPITNPTPDLVAPISRLSTLSENFFTAIYCLIFRRDHALRAYTQDTSGRPFSTMLTCIPTTYHVLHNMMHEQGVWLGTPQVVVNMNVSWLKYASIWILERIPEAFDLAEKMGALCDEVDMRRINHLPSVWHWFGEIIKDDPEGNAAYFNPARLFSRFKHLRWFQVRMPEFIEAYQEAHLAHPTRFPLPPEDLFTTSSIQKDRHILHKNQ